MKKLIYASAVPEVVAKALKPLLDFQDPGMSLDDLANLIDQCLIPYFADYGHPGFHSLFNLFLEDGANLGAEIALAYNQGVTNWQVSPGAVMLEEMCCQTLCRLFDLPQSADATFMYSGTYANQQAIYLALHKKAEQNGFDFAEKGLLGFDNPGQLVLVASEEAHFSLRQTLRMMGLGEKSLICVKADENRRMDIDDLKKTVDALPHSHEIFCVVSTAGTSSIGSIDPILPVASLCRELDCWFHVDAAYGLIYRLLPERKARFEGIDHADSIVWDPHKQFGVPIPSSVLFLKNGNNFRRMAIYSNYFNRKDEQEPNPGLKSPPSTRPLSALPVVTAIRHQGLTGLKKRIRKPLETVSACVKYIRTQQDLELMLTPDLGVFCVRLVPPGFPEAKLNALQKYLYERVIIECERSVSMTHVNGKTALRFLILTPEQQVNEIINTFDYLRRLALQFENKQ